MVMKYSEIKGVKVSKICLGTWAAGGGTDWGIADEAAAIAAIERAIELGVNFLDTAPIYGRGVSELTVGKALKGKRDKVVLATKCGLLPAPRGVEFNLKPASIRKEVEESLQRLGTDYIDLYQIHRPDVNTPLADSLGEMLKLKEEGKIRLIGVSNFGKDLLEEAAKITEIACVQNEYSFLRPQTGDEVFEVCQKHGIAFLAYGPMAGGILSGKYKKEANFPKSDARSYFYKFYKGENFKATDIQVNKFRLLAKKYNATAAQAAINWCFANPAVTCVLTGARNPQQIEDTSSAVNWEISAQDLAALNV